MLFKLVLDFIQVHVQSDDSPCPISGFKLITEYGVCSAFEESDNRRRWLEARPASSPLRARGHLLRSQQRIVVISRQNDCGIYQLKCQIE